jgi:hypothetical protein
MGKARLRGLRRGFGGGRSKTVRRVKKKTVSDGDVRLPVLRARMDTLSVRMDHCALLSTCVYVECIVDT